MSTQVMFVCQWYPPEPAVVPESIVLALRDQGMHVEVLTGVPNYPTGAVAEGYRATRAMSELMSGIKVHRTPLYPSHDTSAAKRLLNYASWALTSAVLGQRRLRRTDANLVYSSPATAALPAMVAKALWRTPYVLLVQDVWPDSIFASGFLNGRLSRVLFWLVNRFVRRTYAMAHHVAVISPGMADLLIERGVPRDKVSVVYNWLPDADEAVDENDGSSVRQRLGIAEHERLFLYSGNHGRAQALETLVDAFKDPLTAPAHVVFLGDGVSKAELVRRGAGHDRIHFLDSVTRSEAVRVSRQADVHVVSLADEPLFAVTMPSKLQSGLAAGMPVLAVTPGDSASLVTSQRAGLAALPGHPASVSEAVIQFNAMTREHLRAMGSNGRESYERLMARKIGAGRLARLLTEAAAGQDSAPVDDAGSTTHEEEML